MGEQAKRVTREPTTPAEMRLVAAYHEHGNAHKAAMALGLHQGNVRRLLKKLGVLKPSAESLLEPPDGQIVKATSTLVRANGDIVQQWVKTDLDREAKLEALRRAVADLVKPATGKASKVTPPKRVDSDLMCVIPIGDPHIGMLSWGAETGDDWDLKIAEQVFTSAIEQAIQASPKCARVILINLGDYFHTDNQSNVTSRSGHQLDVDSRWAKMLEVGIRIQRVMVEKCLEHFGEVVIDNVRGNHDDHSSVMLSHVMRAYFSREPRVRVDVNPALHSYHTFGRCLIATHHGHSAKRESLPLVMAAAKPAEWGASEHRRIYCGHVHHDSVKEFPGVTVETVNTLAARDAYASGAGYISGRDLKVDTWHREDGLINRHVIGIAKIKRGSR